MVWSFITLLARQDMVILSVISFPTSKQEAYSIWCKFLVVELSLLPVFESWNETISYSHGKYETQIAIITIAEKSNQFNNH